jgi:hypothetical protein
VREEQRKQCIQFTFFDKQIHILTIFKHANLKIAYGAENYKEPIEIKKESG